MLGDHAKSPFEVVPDALNGCAHRVGVIPRFLPFLPSSIHPSLSLSPSNSIPLSSSFLIFPPFGHRQLPSPSSSYFIPSFISLLPDLLFLTSHFPLSFHVNTTLVLHCSLFHLSLSSSSSSSPYPSLSLTFCICLPYPLLSTRLTQQLFNHPRRTKVAEPTGCPGINVDAGWYQAGGCIRGLCSRRSFIIAGKTWSKLWVTGYTSGLNTSIDILFSFLFFFKEKIGKRAIRFE